MLERKDAMTPVVTPFSDGVPVVAYALLDESGRMLAARLPDTVFYAASTVKLGVMLAAALAAERGELALDDALQCRSEFAALAEPVQAGSARPGPAGLESRSFRLDPDDRDPLFPADGTESTVADLVAMMIDRSSNEATNVLFDRLGPDRIAEAFRLCGAARTRMQRRIGDQGAARAGLTNETTPADLVTIMRAIASAEVTEPGSAEWMRSVLQAQEHPRIGTVVSPGVPWGSKSGDVPGIEHDVAFVGPAGARRFLAVCTRGFEPEQGREAIRAVAQALLRE